VGLEGRPEMRGHTTDHASITWTCTLLVSQDAYPLRAIELVRAKCWLGHISATLQASGLTR